MAEVNFCCNLILLTPLAVSCFVIASQYDDATNPCSNKDYIIDLVTYSYVAGSIPLGYISASYCACTCGDAEVIICLAGLMVLGLNLLSIPWEVIGIITYSSFDSDCQSEPIAKMILSWDIIILIPIGCFFLMVCLMCFTVFSQSIGQRMYLQEKNLIKILIK